MATSTTSTIKVRDVMSPNPVALPATARITDAAKAMRDSDIGAVVVEDDHGMCGIVTDRDLVIRAIADGKDPKKVKVSEICSRQVSSLSPDEGIDRAVQVMREKALRRLLVMEDSKVIGIVSLGDLAQRLDGRSVLGQISSAQPNH